MGVGGREWQVFGQVQVQFDIAHAQVVVTQGERVFEYLVDAYGNALGLMLAGKTEKILHDAMSALGLFIQLFAVFETLRSYLRGGSQQLAVAENRSKRIVQFVRDAGNKLAYGGHLL